MNRVRGKSFHDDLDRYRALPAYTNVEQAIHAGSAVNAIQLDLGNQELTTLSKASYNVIMWLRPTLWPTGFVNFRQG